MQNSRLDSPVDTSASKLALALYEDLRNKDNQLQVAQKQLRVAEKQLQRAQRNAQQAEQANIVRLARAQAGAVHARGAMEAIFSNLRLKHCMSLTFPLTHT